MDCTYGNRCMSAPAPKTHEASTPPPSSSSLSAGPGGGLYGWPLLTLCGVTFAGYGSNSIVQTVLPVLILDLGGDATLVGATVAIFSIPSILMRPFIGRLVDEWSLRKTHIIGTSFLGLAAFAYLVPLLPIVFAARFIHGTAWAAFNTAGETALLEISPAGRRGEAASTYRLMPSLANIVMPALGLSLLGLFGFTAAFSLAGALGLLGAVLLLKGPILLDRHIASPTDRRWWQVIEPSALLPMGLSSLFAATTILFWVYPPVFVATLGIPLSQLTLYYPAVGCSLLVSRLLIGRRIDRLSRATALFGGAGFLMLALLIAIGSDTVPMLTLAGAVHGIANSLVPATTMAIAMERSKPNRRGSAMATYSMGYQVGLGLGAAAWGLLIDAYGFPSPFIAALLLQAVIAGLVVLRRSELAAASDWT